MVSELSIVPFYLLAEIRNIWFRAVLFCLDVVFRLRRDRIVKMLACELMLWNWQSRVSVSVGVGAGDRFHVQVMIGCKRIEQEREVLNAISLPYFSCWRR